MVTDVLKSIFRDPIHATGYSDRKLGKELCIQENVLWNLLHDVDVESIELRKG